MSASLRGRRVLVTSGPTREALDPVRFLTNASSGRTGWALAAEARRRGARVTVVSGPVPTPPPAGVSVVEVTTALQMYRAALRLWRKCDVAIGAAAVSDWRFARSFAHKVKRSRRPLRLTLIPNPDIIKALSRRRSSTRPQVVVGFALETRGRLASARRKLEAKGLDLIVANGPSSLGAIFGAVGLVCADGKTRALGRRSKADVARAIWDEVETLLERARTS